MCLNTRWGEWGVFVVGNKVEMELFPLTEMEAVGTN